MLPYAGGAATARTPKITGALHGTMPMTTPAGGAPPWPAYRGSATDLPLLLRRRAAPARVVGQHPRGELHVEPAPAQRATRLLGDQSRDLRLAPHQQLGRALEQPAPLAGGVPGQLANARSAASTAARAPPRAAVAPFPAPGMLPAP